MSDIKKKSQKCDQVEMKIKILRRGYPKKNVVNILEMKIKRIGDKKNISDYYEKNI